MAAVNVLVGGGFFLRGKRSEGTQKQDLGVDLFLGLQEDAPAFVLGLVDLQ